MLRNKKGISPIVGVILVVAMTVLLAAIAWTYMSGMVSSPGKQYQVAVKVQRFPNSTSPALSDIIVTYVGGPDQDKVTDIYVNFVGINGTTNVSGGVNPVHWSGSPVPVGDTTKCWVEKDKRVHIVVNATFSDGTKQVLYDSVI